MVNTNIQGPVPLEGAGFIARRNGNFQPGEFKRLTNVELWGNQLVGRRPVKSIAGDASQTVAFPVDNAFGFLGNFGKYAIIASSDYQFAIAAGEQIAMWDPNFNLPVPAPAGSFHRLVGFFRYLKKNYWITLEFSAGVHIKLALYHGDASLDNDTPITYNDAYFATLTRTNIYTILPTDKSFNDFEFKNFFMQGNRLWVVTSLGVYFSAATDPTNFTVPDGGFFKFPDQTINRGFSHKDAIYVLCDNSIHTINYTTDPNTDSFATKISDNMGGEDGCVFRDSAYVINQVGIYRILNNNIDKILDNEFDVGLDYYKNSLTAFEDYLVVNKYTDVNYEKFTSDTAEGRVNLVPNPSFETNSTGYGGSSAYMTRARTDLNPAVGGFSPYSGTDWVMKCTKVNNTAVVNETNLYKNPSFEVDTSFHTAGSIVDLFQVTDVPPGGDPIPEGTKVLQARCDIQRNASNPTAFVERVVVESDFYAFEYFDYLNFNFSYYVGNNIEVNDGSMYLYIYAYDAAFNVISAGFAGDDQWSSVDLNPTVDEWQRSNNWEVVYSLWTDLQAAGVEYIKFKWVLKTKRQTNQTFNFYLDKINLHSITQSEYNSQTETPYFDGNTPDTASDVYAWTGTVGKSTSTKSGDPGAGTDLVKLLEYTANDILVTPGVGYTVGVAIASPLENRDFEVVVRQYSAADVLLSTSTVQLGGTTNVGQWAYLTGQFTATVSAHHIELDIRSKVSMDVSDYVYIDALIVEKTGTYQGYFDGSLVDTVAAVYNWTGVAHASTSTVTVSILSRRLYQTGRQFVPFQADNDLGYNTYFVNMDNGSVHVFDFRDARGKPEVDQGRVVEIYVNPNKDDSGNYNMFFYTNRKTAEDPSSYVFSANMYYISSFRDLDFVDMAVDQFDTLNKYPVKVEIEIDSYIPDGSEYLIKKFRNLLLMAKLPTTDFNVKFGYDDMDYTDEVSLDSVNIADRPHSPYRIGVNQRCKSISIFFYNENFSTALGESDTYEVLEVSDIRTLWTYSGRAIDKSTL